MRKIIFLCTLFLALIFIGCENTKTETVSSEEQAFIAFTNSLFLTEAASDSLSLNYTLTKPENFGISTLPKGFSSFSYADLEKNSLSYENLYSQVASVDPDSFTTEGKLLHATLLDTMDMRIQGQDYLALSESLGPITGIQAQLPVLLAEFRIDDKKDLEQYFCILKTLPGYFSSLLSLEEEKNKRHTLPSRGTINHIVSQCRNFLENSGISMLDTTFQNRILSCPFLSETERQAAIKQNSSYLNQYVHPAYINLIQGLEKLLPFAGENGSLSAYPDGKDYYRYLVRETTGSSQSVEELKFLMSDRLKTAKTTLLAYARRDPSLFSSCENYSRRYPTPEKALTTLQEKMQKDFPPLKNTHYEIKYVDDALKDYLSPAFYLTPPIDDHGQNVIYINPSDSYDPSSLFNTLAHEGYPGHLYQTCYLQDKNCPRLRYILDYGGYTEGWATYAEIYSFKYTGAAKEEVGILRNNMIASLCLYGLCDIGVHFEGWDEKKLSDFLGRYGSYSPDSVSNLYGNLIDEPASYLKYTVGYLEICHLKEMAKDISGDTYSEKAFHTFMLDMGPTSFDIFQEFLSDGSYPF